MIRYATTSANSFLYIFCTYSFCIFACFSCVFCFSFPFHYFIGRFVIFYLELDSVPLMYRSTSTSHSKRVNQKSFQKEKKKNDCNWIFQVFSWSCLHIPYHFCMRCVHVTFFFFPLLFPMLRSQTSIKMKRDVRFDMIVVSIANLK